MSNKQNFGIEPGVELKYHAVRVSFPMWCFHCSTKQPRQLACITMVPLTFRGIFINAVSLLCYINPIKLEHYVSRGTVLTVRPKERESACEREREKIMKIEKHEYHYLRDQLCCRILT